MAYLSSRGLRGWNIRYKTEKPGPRALTPQEVNVEVVCLDPALDALVPANSKIFKLAEGFIFTEGPVWVHEGYLLFSDPNVNTLYKYTPDGELSVFREKSGYAGALPSTASRVPMA
jgi:gluconolactonase